MMLRRNPGKRIVAATMCLVMLFLISPAVLAASPHEDPATAKVVFSGISLFRYYEESLDFVLDKKPAEVGARLGKMPFANIPPSLAEATGSFVAASTNISHLVVQIDEDLGRLRVLVGQFRRDEALVLADNIAATMSRASSNLTLIEQATETTAKELNVSSAPVSSDLKSAYDGVVERINRIREMLDLYQKLLTELILATESFRPTEISLEIQPRIAFVGDSIRFEGVLTAEKRSLAGREVDILINGSRYITATTDASGRYQGVLQVPYWYLPELDVQALYYPRDEDVGFYLASLSPVVRLKVLFYEARLEITLEDKAYPGRETAVSGRFDYGQSPPPDERRVEIYLDDVFVTEFVAQEAFTKEIRIDPEADVGKYIITMSAAATGRYAPVVASAVLNVARATPILDTSLPGVVLIPGSVGLAGKLYSEVGPLSGALINMGLGKSQAELTSAEDGTFDTKMKVGLGFGMVGWQDLTMRVVPQEPWHTPLNTTHRLLMVNVVNLGGLFILLVFLSIYLPGWLGRRLGELPRRRVRPALNMAPPEPAPAYSDSILVAAPATERETDSVEPRQRIFYWYRLAVRLLLRIARISLRPQQTLREFADEHRGILGAGAKYFVELTRMVERLLYSPYRPTEADVENSRQLSIRVEEESRPAIATLPSGGEGRRAQFAPDEFIRRAEGFNSDSRVLLPGQWRQSSTWLWVLLLVTVAYYACLLLFIVPLLLAA